MADTLRRVEQSFCSCNELAIGRGKVEVVGATRISEHASICREIADHVGGFGGPRIEERFIALRAWSAYGFRFRGRAVVRADVQEIAIGDAVAGEGGNAECVEPARHRRSGNPETVRNVAMHDAVVEVPTSEKRRNARVVSAFDSGDTRRCAEVLHVLQWYREYVVEKRKTTALEEPSPCRMCR